MSRKIVVASLFLLAFGAGWLLPRSQSDEKKSEFSRSSIDLGTVVSDIDKSVKFYTEAIGFKELKGFEVPGEYAKSVGLTAGSGLKVHVLVLGEGETATSLKLMQFADGKPKKNENETIDSELGFRYLTIHINDTNAALARLSKAGVKPIAQTPSPLPKGSPEGIFLTIVRDPDGNMIELIGPKK